MANLESIAIGAGGGQPEKLPNAPDNIEETATGVRVKPDEASATPAAKPAEKPEWLPEGFDSPEALAKAYKELRGKMSTEGAPKDFTPETAAAAVKAAGLDLGVMEAEYAKEGKLSEATLAALEAKGLSREQVGKYIAGQEAVATQFRTEVNALAGGAENLQAILKWAGTALSDSEAAAYNTALESGDADTAKLLLRGVVARFTAENGSDPTLITGDSSATRSGATPFQSAAEVAAAFNDRRYKDGDKAYHKQVADRMAVTENF